MCRLARHGPAGWPAGPGHRGRGHYGSAALGRAAGEMAHDLPAPRQTRFASHGWLEIRELGLRRF